MKLPYIGLGTWELREEECTRIVQLALELGYRHVDTAYSYRNHAAIGKAIKGYDRNGLYITSKIAIEEEVDLTNIDESVQKACERALKELSTDYLDLYLIHAPYQGYPLEEIFSAMERLIDQGKVDKVGVSNYTTHHLKDLKRVGYTPFANQVEYHPYLNQEELFGYCLENQIKLVSFRSFGKGKLLNEEPTFDHLGIKYNKSAAQVILRWLIQKGIPAIPKASSEKHLKENLDVFDFSLTETEMSLLDGMNRNQRYCR